jgi:hypothetical protein
MHTDIVDTQLVAYLSLREALGFQMRAEKILLPEFVAYVKAQPNSGPIRAQMALEWACQASTHRGPSGAARRLSMARGFLRSLTMGYPRPVSRPNGDSMGSIAPCRTGSLGCASAWPWRQPMTGAPRA